MADRCARLEPLHSAWLDGELAPSRHATVTAHLASCPACRRSVEGLRVTRSLLRGAPTRRVPAGVLGVGSSHRRRPLAATTRLATAAAVVAGALLGAAYTAGTAPAPDAPVVRVPMELYLADHLAHSSRSAVATPVLVEQGP